jgi:ribosome assembly protein SQT1
VQRLIAHTEPVFAVAVNPAHPEILATGGGDDVGYLWRVGQPQPAFKLEGHSDTVSTIAFSADGSMLASGSLDGSVRVWHVPTGALAVALEGPTQGINWICWHVRGAVLLAGSEDATAWMWKLPEGSDADLLGALGLGLVRLLRQQWALGAHWLRGWQRARVESAHRYR